MEAAAARQDNNHTMQYLRRSALESRLLFRPTASELQTTTRIGFVPTDTQANVEQGAPAGTAAGATTTGQPPHAPHQPRVRATPEQERAELLRRAAEASKPNRGIWAYRVLGVMRDATQAVLKQVPPTYDLDTTNTHPTLLQVPPTYDLDTTNTHPTLLHKPSINLHHVHANLWTHRLTEGSHSSYILTRTTRLTASRQPVRPNI